jgi:hypothetical protein
VSNERKAAGNVRPRPFRLTSLRRYFLIKLIWLEVLVTVKAKCVCDRLGIMKCA